MNRSRVSWVVLAVMVAAVGAASAVVANSGATSAAVTPSSPTNVARGVAEKYIAALDRLDPSGLRSILDKNVVGVDWAYGDSGAFHGAATLMQNWKGFLAVSGEAVWRGSLCCAGPNWAAVTWRLSGSTNPLTNKPFNMKGLSIIVIKKAKIVRETVYYDLPGRSPGIAPSIARKYAAALASLKPATISSLYSRDANQADMATGRKLANTNNAIVGNWQKVFASGGPTHWQGSLGCTGPPMRMDNGTTRRSWAVVAWAWSQAINPSTHKPFKTNGVSILQLDKSKIISETIYYDIPGR